MPITHHRGPQPWTRDVPYAQAVGANGLLFLSGQYGSADDGRVVADDFREQARATFRNIEDVLAGAGATLGDLLHLRVLLLRPDDYPTYREVRAEFLAEPMPASTVLNVAGYAFPGMLLEIEAVAQLPALTTTDSTERTLR